jgi:VWFA-related protein
VIYAVMLFDEDNHDAKPQVLRKLAHETGGQAFAPRRADDVTAVFGRIAREIRSGYTIGFQPPESVGDGFRTIRIVVDAADRRQLVARTRAGYYARAAGRTIK